MLAVASGIPPSAAVRIKELVNYFRYDYAEPTDGPLPSTWRSALAAGTAIFSGDEQPTAWHNDCGEAQSLFGDPLIGLDTMIRWNADWLKRDMPLHDKPTHYEERLGNF